MRSSRDLQFTQLTSMWSKPALLSFPLIFLTSFPTPALHFPIICCSICYCVSLSFLLFAPYLSSPAFLPHDLLNQNPSILHDLPPLLSRVILILLFSLSICTHTHTQSDLCHLRVCLVFLWLSSSVCYCTAPRVREDWTIMVYVDYRACLTIKPSWLDFVTL